MATCTNCGFCSSCGRGNRKRSGGWLAFWLLATLLFIGYAQAQADKKQVAVAIELPVTPPVVEEEPITMSKQWTPTPAEEQSIDRLFREMEEEGRKLPKI